jgi:hypothetical protein
MYPTGGRTDSWPVPHARRVVPLPFHAAHAAGLHACYAAARQLGCDFGSQDGLFLLHKVSHCCAQQGPTWLKFTPPGCAKGVSKH